MKTVVVLLKWKNDASVNIDCIKFELFFDKNNEKFYMQVL